MRLLLADASPWMSGSPSSVIADRFGGVVFDEVDTDEDRRRGVHAFVSVFALLEHIGWYEHTSDWDFHVGIELANNRTNMHIGDGATVAFVLQPGDDPSTYSSDTYAYEDTRQFLQVNGPEVWDAGIEEQAEEHDPLKGYRVGKDDVTEEVAWAFPIRELRRIEFGYCT